MPDRSLEASRDRRVHARLVTGAEVVRYNRAGKWYLEYEDGKKRYRLTVGDAVALAVRPLSEVFYGLPGGEAFDRKVRAAL